MKKLMMIALCVMVFATLAMAQNYNEGSGITGIDKLGAHQNGGRGCVGCHAPHSGARGNGGNAAAGGAVTDPNTGNFALWGQDMGPLYGATILTGGGDYDITLPADQTTNEEQTTGIMMCLSCHDGNIAKGAMMTNQAYEQRIGKLPASYGALPIPTLLGNDGTGAGNYRNDHPIGPKATAGAVGLWSASATGAKRVILSTCGTAATPCLAPNPADAAYTAFMNHYGAFNVVQRNTTGGATVYSGGRAQPMVLPTGATDPSSAYVTCTTCHTPHTMYTYSGTVRNVADADPTQTGNQSGVYPSYFFIAAPYNPGAPITDGTKASSATQFCRQCHFTGAGGSNEGSGIMTVDTQF